MTYAFYTTQGQAASLNIPVEIDTTGYTLSVEFAKSNSFRTINTTKTGTASGKNVTLSLTAGEVNTIGTGYFRIKGTKSGATTILQDGSVTQLSGSGTDHKVSISGPVTLAESATGQLIKTVQDRIREDFTGSSLSTDFWEVVQTGAGQTITVTASELRVTTGTTANAQTIIRSKRSWSGAYRVMFLSAANLLSQRIANQEFELRVTNAAGTSYAGWAFNGTLAANQLARAANNGTSLADVSVIGTHPTNSAGIYEIENFIDEVYYHARASDSVTGRVSSTVRNRQTPDPAEPMFVEIRVKNLATAPASSTTLNLDAVLVQDISELTTEITGGRGGGGASQGIPVTPAGGTMVVNANASTVTPVIVQGASDPVNAVALTASQAYTQGAIDTGTSVGMRPTRLRPVVMLNSTNLTPGTLILEESIDSTTWRETWRTPVPIDGLYHTFDVPLHLRHYRWRLVNNVATAMTATWLSVEAVRGDGAQDIDKNLSFPLTPAAGQALALSTTITFPTIDLGGNHLWDKTRMMLIGDQVANAFIQQSMDGTNFFGLPSSGAAANTAGQGTIIEQQIVGRYLKVGATSGATALTALRVVMSLVSL